MSPELAEAVFGVRGGFFHALTIVLGLCGWLGGQRLAHGWSPVPPVIAYALLLAAFHRFLVYALLEGRLLDVTGAILSAVFFVLLFLLSWRSRIAAKMVSQYPWLYERKGLLGWRGRASG